MRSIEVDRRSSGNDPRRIELRLRHVVVTLDVVEDDGAGDAGRLEQIAQISREGLEVCNPLDVALELIDGDESEPHEGRERAPLAQGRRRAEQEAPLGRALAEPIERGEQS